MFVEREEHLRGCHHAASRDVDDIDKAVIVSLSVSAAEGARGACGPGDAPDRHRRLGEHDVHPDYTQREVVSPLVDKRQGGSRNGASGRTVQVERGEHRARNVRDARRRDVPRALHGQRVAQRPSAPTRHEPDRGLRAPHGVCEEREDQHVVGRRCGFGGNVSCGRWTGKGGEG